MKWPFSFRPRLTKLQLGNQKLAAGDYVRAIELYRAHAEEAPEQAATSFAKIAECYKRSNRIDHPKQVAQGITLVSEGDLASAEHYYRLALQEDANQFASLKGLAEVLPKDSPERLQCLERAVELQPDTLMLIELGDLYRDAKDFSRAYETYRKAQAHKPKEQTAYLRLEEICRELGRLDEAREWADRWRIACSMRRKVGGNSEST